MFCLVILSQVRKLFPSLYSRKAAASSTPVGSGLWGMGESGPSPINLRGVHLAWLWVHVPYACLFVSHPALGRNVLVYAKAEEPQTLGAY